MITSSPSIFDNADEDGDGKLNAEEWSAHYKRYINKQNFLHGASVRYNQDKCDVFYDFLCGLSSFKNKGITKKGMKLAEAY